MNSSGTVALGHGIGKLYSLKELVFSNNQIGSWDFYNPSGTMALGHGIKALNNTLITLKLSNNVICTNESINVLMHSFIALHQLKALFFLPQHPLSSPSCITSTTIQQINHILHQNTKAPSLITLLTSPESVAIYCQNLSWNISLVNLSRHLPSPNVPTVDALMACLQTRLFLTNLDLSYNEIGSTDDTDVSGTIALGHGIAKLSKLRILNLSNNKIGYGDMFNTSGTTALAHGIAHLTHLKKLALSNNKIGLGDNFDPSGTIALGHGIDVLHQLEDLDLSINGIGSWDNDNASGTIALSHGIGSKNTLTTLTLAGNGIGVCAGVDVCKSINPSGTMALGHNIGTLHNLKKLNLSDNWIGYGDNKNSSGTITLSHAIGLLEKLSLLDLSDNYFSWTDSIIVLAQSLNQTRLLHDLNLGENTIGAQGPKGPAALLSVLPNLPHLDLSRLDMTDLTNVSWTQAAASLQKLHSNALMTQCQSSRCSGSDISIHSALIPNTPPKMEERYAQVQDVTEETSFPLLTSSASQPKPFPSGLLSSYLQAIQDFSNHPDVQCASLTLIATKLAATTWPLLMTYMAVEAVV